MLQVQLDKYKYKYIKVKDGSFELFSNVDLGGQSLPPRGYTSKPN